MKTKSLLNKEKSKKKNEIHRIEQIEMTFFLAGYDNGWIGYSTIAKTQIRHRAAIQIGYKSGLTITFESTVHVDALRRCLPYY